MRFHTSTARATPPVEPRAADGRKATKSLVWLVAASVAPLLYLLYVVHYGVNSLFLDDWENVSLGDAALHGHLTFSALWAQHNEERLLFPNLLFVLSSVATHLNLKDIILFDALLMIMAYVLLIRIYRVTTRSVMRHWQVLGFGFIWFSVIDWENALWAFQMAWYVILLSFILVLFLLCSKRLSWGAFAGAIALAIIASFSSFQGLLIWPVGLACIAWRRRLENGPVLAGSWVLSAAITCALYFWRFNFADATGHSGLTYDFDHFYGLVRYFLAETGSVYPSSGFNQTVIGIHEGLGVGLLAIAAVAVWDIARLRRQEVDCEYLPVAWALITFGVLFSLSIAIGTLYYGMIAAVHTSRFTMPNVIMLAGICLYLFSKTRKRVPSAGFILARRWRLFAWVISAALVAQVATSARSGIANARQNSSDRSVAAIIAVKARTMPPRTAVRLVTTYDYPYYSRFEHLLLIARRDRFGEFAPTYYRWYLHRRLPQQLPPPQEG